MKIKILAVLVCIVVGRLIYLNNALGNANVALGAEKQQTLQLATELETLNTNHENVLAELEQERMLLERVGKERDEAYQQINSKIREHQNVLYKLSQQNKAVADWGNTHVPASVAKLRGTTSEVRNSDKNTNHARDAPKALLGAKPVRTQAYHYQLRPFERTHYF